MATQQSTRLGDNRYIVRRRHTFFFQYAVPRRLWDIAGVKNVTRTLDTGDIKEARKRRDLVLAEVRAYLASIEPAADSCSPAGIVATARTMKIHNPNPEQAFREEVSRLAIAQPEPNIIDGELGRAGEEGQRIVSGQEQLGGLKLSEAIAEHLEAIAGRVVPSTAAARRRHLDLLVEFLRDPELASIDRRRLASWVTAMPASLSLKTRGNRVKDVSAFFAWALDSGLRNDDPAKGLGSLLKASSRGVDWTTRLDRRRGRPPACTDVC